MNQQENNKSQEITDEDRLEEEYLSLVDTYQPVFFEWESASRVLAASTPL